MPQEKSAGAVIFCKEPFDAAQGKKDTIKYLLLHYGAGHWDLPKGHVEKGEKPEEAAAREVREETGIKDIEFMLGFKETIKYFYKRDNQNFFKIVIFFLAKTKTKNVKISWEHKSFKWLSYEKALKQLTFDNAKKVLIKANGYLGCPKPRQRRMSGCRTSPLILGDVRHSKIGFGHPDIVNFCDKVYNVVKKIPKGEVLTYKELAKLAGKPEAFRAVGNILNKNKDKKIPCHRVIRSDGKIGGYNLGQKRKIKILKKEGFIDSN